jgi:spore coat protein U-like protein
MNKILVSILVALMLVAVMALPAIAAEEEASTTASVSVGEIVNITLAGSINFGSVTPPVTDQGANGQTDTNPAITITVESDTNVNVDISIMGALTSGTLALSNWKYSGTYAGSKISIPASYSEVYDNVGDGVYAFFHWIDVPMGTTSGNHQISVSYKAETHS